jgi:hypothetical protein
MDVTYECEIGEGRKQINIWVPWYRIPYICKELRQEEVRVESTMRV